MNVGSETKRNKLRMIIHRGGVGQRPNRQSASHAVKAGEDILSGMLMTLVDNGTTGQLEWVRGVVTGTSLPNRYYFAVDDAQDGDVRAAGNLQGLSVTGDYELATSQFVTPAGLAIYRVGTLLTPYIPTDLANPTQLALKGRVRPVVAADANVVVVGVVVKDYRPPVDYGARFEDLIPSTAGEQGQSPGMQGGTFIYGQHTNAENLELLRFETVQPYVANVT